MSAETFVPAASMTTTPATTTSAMTSTTTTSTIGPSSLVGLGPSSSITTSSSSSTSTTTIIVPKLAELAHEGTAAASPAITASGATLPPPTVSPMAPIAANVASIAAALHHQQQQQHQQQGATAATATAALVKAHKPSTKSQAGMNGGRWTEQEHQSFLAGLRLYGREWKKVASKIKTRTSAQIRSHAQKYFAKLARDDEARKLGPNGGGLLQHLQSPEGAASSSFGYMSDGGSSTTAGNLSGDEGGDTDSSATQPRSGHLPIQPRALAAVHPYPPLALAASAPPPPPPASTSSAASSTSTAATAAGLYKRLTPIAVAPMTGPTTKKRARAVSSSSSSSSSDGASPSPPSALGTTYKHRKLAHPSSTAERLPSPEELVERVSPSVRQRLGSLIDAEMCALQVLSCYAWLQHQPLPSSSSSPPPTPHEAVRLLKVTRVMGATNGVASPVFGSGRLTMGRRTPSSIY